MILSIQTSGFLPDSYIYMIGMKTLKDFKIWGVWNFSSEKNMLEDFIEYFTSTDDKIIIGFNILKFEIPMILLKSQGLRGYEKLFKKINFSNFEDIFVILTFLNHGVIRGLEFYKKTYNISTNLLSDREMFRLYQKGEYEKLDRAMKEKLDVINEIFLKLWGKIKEENND